ncbi:MAG: hypothetical protein ABR499_15245 [Gemmatimonadaceae bacterium]
MIEGRIRSSLCSLLGYRGAQRSGISASLTYVYLRTGRGVTAASM